MSMAFFLCACADYDIFDRPPDPVVLQDAENISDTSLTLRWTQSKDPEFAVYRICYSLNYEVRMSDKLIDTIPYNYDTTIIVHGLKPDSLYYFRVFVINSSDISRGSNILPQRTQRGIHTIVLSKPEATDTVVDLQWTKCLTTDGRQYLILYDTLATIDSSSKTARKFVVSDINDTTATITGLMRAKSYSFRVFVQNGFGNIVASSNTEQADIPRAYPSPIRLWADSATDTMVVLRWTMNRDPDFLQYRIYLSADNQVDAGDSLIKTVAASMDTVFKVSHLASDQQFWFMIAAKNERGLMTNSNVKPNIPVVLSLAGQRTTDTTIGLYWSIFQSPGFSMYKLVRDTTTVVVSQQGFEVALPRPDKADVTSFTDTINDTTKTYHYRIYVSEKDSAGAITVSGSNDLSVAPGER